MAVVAVVAVVAAAAVVAVAIHPPRKKKKKKILFIRSLPQPFLKETERLTFTEAEKKFKREFIV